jgi:hypothetical protein
MGDTAAPSSFHLFKGTAQGTLVYLSVYGSFLSFQSFSKIYLAHQKRKELKGKKISFRKVKYYNSDDTVRLTLARVMLYLCNRSWLLMINVTFSPFFVPSLP